MIRAAALLLIGLIGLIGLGGGLSASPSTFDVFGVFSSPSNRSESVNSQAQTATIVRDVDGDTIKVDVGGKQTNVRLIGIDTPETHKPGVKVECGGREASENMTKIARAGATVRLTYDPTQDHVDRYGRLLAYASIDGQNLQLAQLRAGLAEVYVYGGKPFQRVESFRRAEHAAEQARRGVWGECGGDFHSEQ